MNLIPLALLVDWRSPDRDLYRVLTVRGPLTTKALAADLSISTKDAHNALGRMYRLGVVSLERLGSAPKSGVLWRTDYVASQVEFASDRAHGMAGKITRRKRAA